MIYSVGTPASADGGKGLGMKGAMFAGGNAVAEVSMRGRAGRGFLTSERLLFETMIIKESKENRTEEGKASRGQQKATSTGDACSF
jgi:hypothetical protein